MSTIIKFDLKELRKLAHDKNSCIIEEKVTQNLALQPRCLGNLNESLKHLLDYRIGKYDKKLEGILLSYKNLRVLQNVGEIRNDNADIHFQVQADYFIFRPHVGAILRGVVIKKCLTHLGILVHRVFNVVIPRPTEEPGDRWIGTTINEGQEVSFRIVVLDLFGALPYIRGEFDESLLGGDDGDVTYEPFAVSYVNFDKTKPCIPHHSDDEQEDVPKLTNNNTKSKKKRIDGNVDSNVSCSKIKLKEQTTEKTKSKRQSKLSDSCVEAKQARKNKKST